MTGPQKTEGRRQRSITKLRARASIVLLLFSALTVAGALAPGVSAANPTPVVAATPGYVNLGMNVTITVTAPAAGTYTVSVETPSGSWSSLSMIFTTAGQSKSAVFGFPTAGWGILVNQVGSYNVDVYQGQSLLGTTAFTSTNQILISVDYINCGYCLFIASAQRGQEALIQIHAVYASNNQPIALTAAQGTAQGDVVSYTLPGSGGTATASVHAAGATAWSVPWYQGDVWPVWNASWIGNYNPVVNVKDSYGNVGTFNAATASGYGFQIYPANLNQTVTLTDAATGHIVAGMASNENVTVTAKVQYLVLPTALSAVSGFNGPLDAAVHGGVVSALVGYGYFNTTSNTFGSAKNPGGSIATVNLAYSTTTKLWTGTFNTGTLPALPTGVTTYTVIVNSHDSASPANLGTETLAIPPIAMIANAGSGAASTVTVGTATVTATNTVTATSVSTATTTAISTAFTTAVSTLTQTATSTISSIVSSISTLTTSTVSVAVSTLIQTAQAVPSWAYVMMFLFLVIGGLVGFVLKRTAK